MKRRADSAGRAVLLAGATAVLPFAALNASAPAAQAPASFAPPQTRLVLTRTLHSPLADGKEIVSRRSYELRIAPDGLDYRIDGTLIDSKVDAPAPLGFLAELERNRPDTGLFPLRLDSRGLLLAPGERPASDSIHRAAAHVEQRIPGSARADSAGFVKAVENSGSTTRWPEDLFVSRTGLRTNRQAVTLPDGTKGHVTIEIEVTRPSDTQTLVERRVITEIGSSRRMTREEWLIAEKG